MLKWIIIALAPIILLLLIEEATEFFWKRFMNGPGEKTEETWKERLLLKCKGLRTSLLDSRIMASIMNSKLMAFLRKRQKDPSA